MASLTKQSRRSGCRCPVCSWMSLTLCVCASRWPSAVGSPAGSFQERGRGDCSCVPLGFLWVADGMSLSSALLLDVLDFGTGLGPETPSTPTPLGDGFHEHPAGLLL